MPCAHDAPQVNDRSERFGSRIDGCAVSVSSDMDSVAPKGSGGGEQRGSGTHRLGADRRRISRVGMEIIVEIELADGRRAPGVAQDIGMGGMFVEAAEVEPYGSELTVLVPHAGSSLRLPATVRWCTDRGMGVQFGLIGARETHAIARSSSTPRARGWRVGALSVHSAAADGRRIQERAEPRRAPRRAGRVRPAVDRPAVGLAASGARAHGRRHELPVPRPLPPLRRGAVRERDDHRAPAGRGPRQDAAHRRLRPGRAPAQPAALRRRSRTTWARPWSAWSARAASTTST